MSTKTIKKLENIMLTNGCFDTALKTVKEIEGLNKDNALALLSAWLEG